MVAALEIKFISSHKDMARAMLDFCNSSSNNLIARHLVRFNVEKRIIEVLPYSFPTESIPIEILEDMIGGEVDYWDMSVNVRLATVKGGSLAADMDSETPWYSYGPNIFLTTGLIGQTVKDGTIKGLTFVQANKALLAIEASKHFQAVEYNPLSLY